MATMTQAAGHGMTFERELGRARGSAAGPTLVVVAGIHGNEHGGAVAARRVFDRLAADRTKLSGEVLALAGNLASLRLRRRFATKDLNRQWTEEKVAALLAREPSVDDAEDREQRALIACIDEAQARARGPIFFLDLHTTSAAGFPFALYGDSIAQSEFASRFPLPIILGLEEEVDGVLSSYMSRRGCVSLAVEGGQHDDPSSIDHLEAVIWVGLAAAGLAERSTLSRFAASRAHLDRARGEIPRVLEVLRRHAITPDDEFVMEPGFANLARVRSGQLLARDRRGDVRAESDGFVLLPLYQGQGEDGFFWGRELSRSRIRTSVLLRKAGLDRVLPLLPGVRRDSAVPDRLVLSDEAVARYPLSLFRTLGMRRVREKNGRRTVGR
jgi:predicted deacylase